MFIQVMRDRCGGRWAAIVALSIAAAVHVRAATVHVVVRPHGHVAADCVVRFHPVVSASGANEVEVVPGASGEAVAQLSDGEWTVATTRCNAWHGEQYLTVSGDRMVNVDVWSAARLSGRVVTSDRHTVQRIIASFQGVSTDGTSLEASTTCRVSNGTFVCTLPSGMFDLRLRVPGYIAHFFTARSLPAAGADIGTLEVVPGQSIIGRVDVPRGVHADVTKTIVSAAPAGDPADAGPRVFGAALLRAAARPNRRGAFQIDGVMPGDYVVSAANGKLVSEKLTIPVRPGRETELNEILHLVIPSRLTLMISPRTSADHAQWSVELSRKLAENQYSIVTQSRAGSDGSWTSPPLPPAEYRVELTDEKGDVLAVSDVNMSATDQQLLLSIDPRVVRGTLRLGEKSIAGNITFFDARGRRAKAIASADGAFEVRLPDRSQRSWSVTVENEELSLHRTLSPISLPPPDSAEDIEIAVPASVLFGSVVDGDAAPVAHALVTMKKVTPPLDADTTVQGTAGPDGVFSFAGLSSGRYSVSAEGPGERSDDTVFQFDASEPVPSLRLVAHRRRALRGVVTSDFGPVPGAAVFVLNSESPAPAIQTAQSAPDGRFEVDVEPSARELNIITAVPGFAYALDHIHYEKGIVGIKLLSRGGMLALNLPHSRSGVLRRNGASVPLSLLALQWPVRIERGADRDRYVVPMMEPGMYTFCVRESSEESCAAGVLDGYGELALTPSQ